MVQLWCRNCSRNRSSNLTACAEQEYECTPQGGAGCSSHRSIRMSSVSVQCAASSKLVSTVRDYAELTKIRVTALIVMTGWCGYFLGSSRSGVSSLSGGLLHALLGIALVSSGTAALNEVMELDTDRRMHRTAMRPLP